VGQEFVIGDEVAVDFIPTHAHQKEMVLNP